MSSPRISVLVLAFRHVAINEAIGSVFSNTTDADFEVRILLNGASPEVRDQVAAMPYPAMVLDSEVNLGFSAGMNLLAADCESEYLIFLNDDVIVQPGWLNALVATADANAQAAAVCGRMVFPDGRLQEAGGQIRPDGLPVQVGYDTPDTDPSLHQQRIVDYGSAAGLLVRREAFEKVGGFDERYFPAYFEDVDLCLRLRETGQEVIY